MSENTGNTEKKYLSWSGLTNLVDRIKVYDAASLTLSKEYTDEQVAANKVTVDSSISSDSTNPVESKAIKAEFQEVQGQLDNLASQLGTIDLSGLETKSDATAKLTEAKSYTDQEVGKITSGTIVVKEAEHAGTADSATSADSATNADHATSADSATNADHADSADSATKATQDASGNVITETYETKADAQTTKDELTSLIDGKADSSHSHDIATAEANGFMSAEDKAKLDSIDPDAYIKSIGLTVTGEDAVITWGGSIPSVEGVEF